MSLKRESVRYTAFDSVEKMSTCSEEAAAKSCGATGENSTDAGGAFNRKVVGCFQRALPAFSGRRARAMWVGSKSAMGWKRRCRAREY